MSRSKSLSAIVFALGLTWTNAYAQQKATPAVTQPKPTVQLPNGASSINETYGDWTVDCRIVNAQKQCVLSQVHGKKQTGQRVFAMELNTPRGSKIEGTILMPLGVNLDSGAILKLDDRDFGPGLRFSTCVPQGCLLPVSFAPAAADAMQKGSKLVVASLNLSSGEPITFTVSLNGFNAALERVSQLGR